MCTDCLLYELSKLNLLKLGRFGLQTTKTSNGRSGGNGTGRTQRVTSTRDDFTATSAFPNSRALALNRVFAAKYTSIRGVLRDLNLLHQLSQCGTVAGSVLAGNAYFFRAFTHLVSLVCLLYNTQWLARNVCMYL